MEARLIDPEEPHSFIDLSDNALYILVRILEHNLPKNIPALPGALTYIRPFYNILFLNREPTESDINGIRGILEHLPTGYPSDEGYQPSKYNPFKYIAYSQHYDVSIAILLALGYNPNLPDDKGRLIHERTQLNIQQWKTLITKGNYKLCNSARETTSQLSTNIHGELVHSSSSAIPLPGTHTGTLQCNISPGMHVSPLIALVDDVITYVIKRGGDMDPKYSISAADVYRNIITYQCNTRELSSVVRYINREIQEYEKVYTDLISNIPPQTQYIGYNAALGYSVRLEWLLKRLPDIRDGIERCITELYRAAHQGALSEMLYLPPTGRFPGEQEMRRGAERFREFATTSASGRGVDYYSLVMNLSPFSGWEEILSIAKELGVVPFKNKKEAIQVIAERVIELIHTIRQTSECNGIIQVISVPVCESLPLEEAKIRAEASLVEWSQGISTALGWEDILSLCTQLRIISIPTSKDGLVTFLKEYVTQL